MTFARRYIDLTFQLGKGSFGNDGFTTVTLRGLRVSASISKAGGVSMSNLQMRVYGMSLSDMNALSTLGKPLVDGRNNRVTVEAGTEGGGKNLAFAGTISEAWVDMQNAPDGVLIVQGFSGLLAAVKPVSPSSFQGSANAADVLAGLATQMGVGFENNGVSVQLSNPYFPGTALSQVQRCADAAGINWAIDDDTLAIWPRDGYRAGQTPVLSAATGLVGYPVHTENGIRLTTLYNPSVVFGAQVKVESALTPANGTWTVFGLNHELEAETPSGAWFSTMDCSILGHDAPLAR